MPNDQLILKPLSSLEKCFTDEDLSTHPATDRFVMFRNERLSFQVGIYNETPAVERRRSTVAFEGELAPYAKAREVISIAAQNPTRYPDFDSDLLRDKPCLAPDPIRPLHYRGKISLPSHLTQSLWVDVELPENFPAGNYALTVALPDADPAASVTVEIRVKDACLPAQKLIHTEWFYTDCIAEAYRVRPFSEKHWKLVEKYLRTAVRNGINMILTPVFTPELDTYVGGERLTTQLTGITVTGKDTYEFDFSKLDRWIDLCKSVGVKYFEIPHFFTQWGATGAPKYVANVNGKQKRIFGWKTPALGEEYGKFLSQFIPALLAALKKNGVDKNCFFHVSDEPRMKDLEHYRACLNLLKRYLGDYPIIDALSDYDFYEMGVIEKPVPKIRNIQPFLDKKIPGLWAYYCGHPATITGRNLVMALPRTRILGVQLWLAGIEGFLHWGFNFYHNSCSYDYVDPLAETGGEFFTPSGDACLVYPGNGDEVWESLRLNALREAMDDMRALDLLSEKRGRAFAEELVRKVAGGDVDFFNYPHDAAFFLNLREAIAEAL